MLEQVVGPLNEAVLTGAAGPGSREVVGAIAEAPHSPPIHGTATAGRTVQPAQHRQEPS